MATMRALLLLLLISIAQPAWAAVGKVEQQTGFAEVIRSGEKQASSEGTGIEMQDDVRTGDGIVGIGFEDKTRVRIEKHSKLIIDDFVYDPRKPTASKLGLKVALGTVRYASGLIAKQNRQQVAIRTPTASIGVRGTAFSMTVDEIGRSLVILLPNADGTVGEISVESDVGRVILNRAFQATSVGTVESKPTPPVILDLTEAQINNLLIIKEPKVKGSDEDDETSSSNILDQDFLEFRELDENQLDKDELEFTNLDVNMLDVNLLGNLLDLLNSKIFTTESEVPNPIKPGKYENNNLIITNDGQWRIYRNVDNAEIGIVLGGFANTRIIINQRNVPIEMNTVEGASDSVITINQN